MYQRWENSEGCAGRLFCDLEFFIDKGLDIGGLMGEDVDGSGVIYEIGRRVDRAS